MKKLVIFGGIILLFIIGISWYIKGLNRIVWLDEGVSQSWAEIESQLLRRNDLIPNLLNTVKGYMKHEEKIFTYVADARTRLAGAIRGGAPLDSKIDAARELQTALSRLLMIVENYPQLRANETFLKLQDELAGTENRIAVARTRYNRMVQSFNSYIREVFGRFFASKRGLTKAHPYFEIEEEAKALPKVEF